MIMSLSFAHAITVWIKEGDGSFIINRRPLYQYFRRLAYREKVLEPFVASDLCGEFDVWCTVKGGGTTGTRLHVS
jgi:small subunit ribosomal protein S9